ncbi:MAG: ABC transporter substrate-binding protein [Deltaproteobacteria bacterium]|nr:ABC transporter substrate-binding protein [Deltaproteobacteria bacterium]
MSRQKSTRLIACLSVSMFLVLVTSLSFAEKPRFGGTLRIGARLPQFHRLDPRYNTLETMAPASGMIYDCLFNWGPEGYKGLVPQLATDYETTDNKVWIVHLRKGVKFHNGREMTAEDVKANLDWRINLPSGWKPIKYKEYIKFLRAVEVVDRYTIKIILDRPFSPLLRILAYALRGIVPPEEVKKWGSKFSAHPCGTGPYRATLIKPKEKIVLERFDDYWGPRPYVDRIEYIFIRSDEARLIALQKGEIDMAQQVLEEHLSIVEKDPNVTCQQAIVPFVLHKHYFNFRRWPMTDLRFRKAIWMGADWKNIAINTRANKSGLYARTLLDYTDFFNPGAVHLVPGYNPEEAKKLIRAVEKDAGKKIPPIYWLDSSSFTGRNIAEPAKMQLAQIGVTLDLHLMSHAIWYEKVYKDPKAEWSSAGYGLGFGLDPFMGFNTFATNSGTHADGKSIGGYSNPEFDQWLDRALKANTEDARTEAYHEAEKVLLKDVACIPLTGYRTIIGYNKKVKGFKLTNTGCIYVTNTWTNLWLQE